MKTLKLISILLVSISFVVSPASFAKSMLSKDAMGHTYLEKPAKAKHMVDLNRKSW